MADYEKYLVSRILFSGEVKNVIDRKLHGEMFADDRNKKAFNFLINYYQKYGSVPTIELFEKEFEDYSVPHTKEPIEFCIDKVVDTYIRNKGSDILLKNTKSLIENPIKGLEALKRDFSRLHLETNPTEDVSFLRSIEQRKKKYVSLKALDGIDGFHTPWQVLNTVTMGWHPEEFVVVVSRPGIGKSFLLVIFAQYCWDNNLNVLFITNEMSTMQILRRFDAVHFKLPYAELKSGLLADGLEKIYFDGLEKLKDEEKPPLWVIGDVGGVLSIGSKIDEYKPDIVIIDGMYLLQDDRKGSNKWERTSNISWDLKQLARKKKVPIIASTQFNRAADEVKTKFKDVNLSMLGFSDSIGQDADIVIGLFRNKDMELSKEMFVRMLKVREGEPKDFLLGWDLHTMLFPVMQADDDTQVIEDGELDEKDIDF